MKFAFIRHLEERLEYVEGTLRTIVTNTNDKFQAEKQAVKARTIVFKDMNSKRRMLKFWKRKRQILNKNTQPTGLKR